LTPLLASFSLVLAQLTRGDESSVFISGNCPLAPVQLEPFLSNVVCPVARDVALHRVSLPSSRKMHNGALVFFPRGLILPFSSFCLFESLGVRVCRFLGSLSSGKSCHGLPFSPSNFFSRTRSPPSPAGRDLRGEPLYSTDEDRSSRQVCGFFPLRGRPGLS